MSGMAAAGWAFAITPYLWLPDVSGTLVFEPPPASASRPEAGLGDDYLENLERALMLSFEARKGDWSVLADFITLDFGRESADLEGFLLQAAVSRALSPSLEVLGGLRFLALEASLDGQLAGTLVRKEELTAAIVGVRGRVGLGEKSWFVPYYLDAGAGSSSSLTWQGVAGVGYAFKWGEAFLVYRHLYYDQDEGKLLQGIEFSGPALGARLRF